MPAQPTYKNTDIEALRALAIVLVIMAHVARLLPSDHWYMNVVRQAGFGFGVDIFFCVSGFIITQSLVNLMPAGPDLRRFLAIARPFLIRRFWRLMPSALFWILALLLAAAVLDGTGTLLSFRDSLQPALTAALQVADFTFSSCRDAGKCGEFGIYWSLSLENQFYLVLPLLAVCAGRRLLPFVFLAAFAAQFFIERQLTMPTPFLWALRTDAICLGAFLALVSHTRLYRELEPTMLRLPLLPLALLVYLVALMARISVPQPAIAYAMGVTALLCGMLTWIASYDRCYLTSNRFVRTLAVYVGSRSYAIYLTHMLAMSLAAWLAQHGPLSGLAQALGPGVAVTAFLGLTLLFSELNYRMIETPLRAYGKRRTARMMPEEGLRGQEA
ncbi:acyltransferase family protein [Massilia suwonensis]|uniref:Acyltransferase family protein n=1 Tax=Massilia suwonensis TaxID=648895 RepID=A0ABW0MQG3_9BURK